jgi:hypothetical protein
MEAVGRDVAHMGINIVWNILLAKPKRKYIHKA